MRRIISVILLSSHIFAEPLIFLSPSEITTQPNKRIGLSLSARDIKDAIAIQLDLFFDPSIVKVEDVEKKGLFDWLCWIQRPDSVRIIAGINPSANPVSGTGTIGSITIFAQAVGTSSISITNPWIIKQISEERPKTSNSTITVRLGEPYLQFKPIGTQSTHNPFPITIYALNEMGEPMNLTAAVTLSDLTNTIEGFLTFNGTNTTGMVTIGSIPNGGLNRIKAIANGVSGESNEFLIFAKDSCVHNIEIPTQSGTVSLHIDPSIIGKDYYIDVTGDITGTITLPDESVGLGVSIDLYTEDGEAEGTLLSSFKLEMSYKEEELGGVDETTLRLYTLVSNKWEMTENSGVDITNNICYGWVSHLSFFCIIGSKTISSQKPLFWPNPYYTRKHSKIEFSPQIKKVVVYNLSGELVKEFEYNVWEWPEKILSSGVYILILFDEQGTRYRRKFGVVK